MTPLTLLACLALAPSGAAAGTPGTFTVDRITEAARGQSLATLERWDLEFRVIPAPAGATDGDRLTLTPCREA